MCKWEKFNNFYLKSCHNFGKDYFSVASFGSLLDNSPLQSQTNEQHWLPHCPRPRN